MLSRLTGLYPRACPTAAAFSTSARAAAAVAASSSVVRRRTVLAAAPCLAPLYVCVLCAPLPSAVCSINVQPRVKSFINGKFVESTTSEWIPLHNPVCCCARAALHSIPHPQRLRAITYALAAHSRVRAGLIALLPADARAFDFIRLLPLASSSSQATNELVCMVPQNTQSEVCV